MNRNKQKSNKNSLIECIFFLSIFSENFGFFRVVSVCFGLFRNSLFWLLCFYTKSESFVVLIEPKQTEELPKQFDRKHILVFFQKILGCFGMFGLFWVVSVCFALFRFVSVVSLLYRNREACFGLFLNSSVCSKCFDIGLKHCFTKKTETDLVSIRTEIFFRFEDTYNRTNVPDYVMQQQRRGITSSILTYSYVRNLKNYLR